MDFHKAEEDHLADIHQRIVDDGDTELVQSLESGCPGFVHEIEELRRRAERRQLGGAGATGADLAQTFIQPPGKPGVEQVVPHVIGATDDD